MMKTFRTIFCGMVAIAAYAAAAQEEEFESITVGLSTESSLEPLYLTAIVNNQAAYGESYLKELHKILSFDLQHNGRTYLAKKGADQERYATSGKFEELGLPSEWKKFGVIYVVKPSVANRTLSAMILDSDKQSLKRSSEITLSGDLNQDRRQIHKLADSIHKGLFDSDGVASTKILYTVKGATGAKKDSSELWEADYDGGNARQITTLNTLCVTPVYIPPKPGYSVGSAIYTSYQTGQPKIYVSSLKEGSTGQRLTYMRGNQLMPTISRQRDKVAFISDITGNPDLFMIGFSTETGAIGKPQQLFSAKQATQGSPTFSPDGKKIAFVSDKDGSPRIYVIDVPAAGTNLQEIKATLISKRNRENSAPCWSADGTKIAYCARQQGDRQIWYYDFSTGQEKQLTRGSGNKENPSWASNSLHLVYNAGDGDANELYIINLNEAEPVKISSGRGEKRFPNWEPTANR